MLTIIEIVTTTMQVTSSLFSLRLDVSKSCWVFSLSLKINMIVVFNLYIMYTIVSSNMIETEQSSDMSKFMLKSFLFVSPSGSGFVKYPWIKSVASTAFQIETAIVSRQKIVAIT